MPGLAHAREKTVAVDFGEEGAAGAWVFTVECAERLAL